MFKHAAESIKESSRKQFISKAEKDKYGAYPTRFIEKKDSYTKKEFDEITKDLSETYENVEGKFVTVTGTKPAPIQEIQLFGSTIQNPNNLADIKSVGQPLEDGQYKLSILSSNKNLISHFEPGDFDSVGNEVSSSTVSRTGFIKVYPGKSYTLNGGMTSVRYDINKKYIDTLWLDGTITIPNGCEYLRFKSNNANILNRQLEEGTQATPYTPHISNKSSILMPCQLGNGDRLYYDNVENAWCVDKVETDKILKGNENWVIYNPSIGNTVSFRINMPNGAKQTDNIICNRFNIISYNDMWTKDTEGISFVQTYIAIRIDKSKLETLDVAGFKKWLQANNVTVKYQAINTTKIVLPKSVQIKLSSHLNKTHIYTQDTEVEPVIKAKVSKSMGATVQANANEINILKDRVGDIEGLKKSQDVDYSTDKGYLVCEHTQDGVVKDMVVKGKTLVNLVPSDVRGESGDDYSTQFELPKTIEKDKEYTLVVYGLNLASNSLLSISSSSGGSNPFVLNVPMSTQNTFKFKSNESSFDYSNRIRIRLKNNLVTNVVKYVILEGNHTQTPPQGYFTGMLSVGEDVDKIEVSSVKSDGNLFGINGYENTRIDGKQQAFVNTINNNEISISDNKDAYTLEYYIDVIVGEKYSISYECVSATNVGSVGVYEIIDNTYGKWLCGSIKLGLNNFDFTATTSKIGFILYSGSYDNPKGTSVYRNISMTKKGIINELGHKSDKKAILFQDKVTGEWKKPTLHEWDEVNETQGKLYKRSGKVVLNGSENWILKTISDTTVMRFDLVVGNMASPKCELLCDKFTVNNTHILETENIGHNTGGVLVLFIGKSKLTTPDIAGFKKWLQSNNVTAIYQLATEEVFDIAPINVDAYANETMISINCGAITPKQTSFAMTGHIGNVVNNLKSRVSRLEREMLANAIFQNRLLLASTYTSDSTDLKVDIASLDNGMTVASEEDYDLFNLIRRNIIVGIDNYDRLNMEDIIDFYTMTGRLSYDMCDSLFLMIEIQHNPPVEEVLPEEEENHPAVTLPEE